MYNGLFFALKQTMKQKVEDEKMLNYKHYRKNPVVGFMVRTTDSSLVDAWESAGALPD